ncbi:MAG: hypothetical protein BWK73_01950 [Thiothrix lacustris]|uniref:Uncharacterized protein n=1 Tax=Thiothrix lacustris TaxID=525917 RepID=A0A1Y1R077_9GAMM|nr:MAG: hypothetical protein BWK73_01950 [Thiothrix lacustris]
MAHEGVHNLRGTASLNKLCPQKPPVGVDFDIEVAFEKGLDPLRSDQTELILRIQKQAGFL